jgi:ATP-dependent RNA helicase DDX51/DBP6
MVFSLLIQVESAQGQRNFAEEQEKLVGKDVGRLGGNMLIDILITTPGRLAEHILHTPGFTLQHLKFLVLDEADRLLHQSFQNWTELVMREITWPKVLNDASLDFYKLIDGDGELPILGQRYIDKVFGETPPIQRPVRKLIFSATLTHDIGKLSSLQIQSPEIISIGTEERDNTAPRSDDAIFTVPTTLHEYAVPCTTENKPLILLHLLQKYNLQDKTLIFTNSAETATRLTHLLTQIYQSLSLDTTPALISSEVPLKRRRKLLSSFKSGRTNIIITTDLLSRGMDIRGVQHIVSYDAPSTARIYVHRAGRTARAGREGDVWCLVTNTEARWFWKSVVSGIRRVDKVERVKLSTDEIPEELDAAYRSVIEV